jgi:hypothetical protein
MKEKIILNKTNIRRILALLVFISSLIILKKIAPDFAAYSHGAETLDMRFGYSVNDVLELFTNLGADGRFVYARYFCVDFVFIASFAIVQNDLLKLIMGKTMLSGKWRALLAIAYIRALFDAVENIIILCLIFNFPAIPPLAVTAASAITRLKFVALGLWMLAIPAVLIARAVVSKNKGRSDFI